MYVVVFNFYVYVVVKIIGIYILVINNYFKVNKICERGYFVSFFFIFSFYYVF